MTRESKLALILSFVLILVVGVLVSDHFSQANGMDPERLDAMGLRPIAQLPGAERSRTDNAIDRVLPVETHDAFAGTADPDLGADLDPVIIANSSTRGSLLDELSNGLNKTMDDLRAPALASPLAHTETATRSLGAIEHSTYIVEEGDSLYQIAKRTLGDGNRWVEIQRLNAGTIGSNGIISPGMKLELPTNARVRVPTIRSAITPQTVRSEKSVTTYTVSSGDTLGEISSKLLGTSRRVDEIVELNGLSDPNDIRVGMKLKIPSK